MSQYLVAAGPLVWPLLLVGAATLLVSILYARSARRELLPLAAGGAGCTLILGLLGTVVGLQLSAAGLPHVEAGGQWIVWLGLSESLGNLVLALVVCLLERRAAGDRRLARPAPGRRGAPRGPGRRRRLILRRPPSNRRSHPGSAPVRAGAAGSSVPYSAGSPRMSTSTARRRSSSSWLSASSTRRR